jgi:hypothetical protein
MGQFQSLITFETKTITALEMPQIENAAEAKVCFGV